MNTIQLEIVTPIRVLDEGQVSYVRCPGIDGSFGVMANHIEGIIALDVGEIKVRKDGQEKYLATSGGFAEIRENRLEVLVESVEESSEIDTERAEMSIQRAKKEKRSLIPNTMKPDLVHHSLVL